jgi:hypothetical protein
MLLVGVVGETQVQVIKGGGGGGGKHFQIRLTEGGWYFIPTKVAKQLRWGATTGQGGIVLILHPTSPNSLTRKRDRDGDPQPLPHNFLNDTHKILGLSPPETLAKIAKATATGSTIVEGQITCEGLLTAVLKEVQEAGGVTVPGLADHHPGGGKGFRHFYPPHPRSRSPSRASCKKYPHRGGFSKKWPHLLP